jgi:hypothetical protein
MRAVIYARLSKNRNGLSTNTAIQGRMPGKSRMIPRRRSNALAIPTYECAVCRYALGYAISVGAGLIELDN